MSVSFGWLRFLVGVSLTTTVGACGSSPRGEPFTTRDSAGVRIVTSTRPAWTDGGGWRIAPTPDLAIGAADGSDEYLLSSVWDATRLATGVIVIGVAGAHELRWYDSAGRFLKKAGRKGSGPGEFSDFADLRMWSLPSGRVAVRDIFPRVNVFDTAGGFARTIVLEAPMTASRPTLIGALADGSLLTMAWEAEGAIVPGQVTRSAVRYFRHAETGVLMTEIGRAETAPRYIHNLNGVTHFPYLPLTAEPVAVADSASMLLIRRGDPVIERLDLDGRLMARYAWQPERHPVTPEFYRRYVAADLATTTDPQQKRLYEAYYALTLPLPDSAPSSRELFVDDTRHIWVERFRFPGEVHRTWDILDPGGRWLGALSFPGRFWFHRAGGDYLLGATMDSLDVERVERYRLSRP